MHGRDFGARDRDRDQTVAIVAEPVDEDGAAGIILYRLLFDPLRRRRTDGNDPGDGEEEEDCAGHRGGTEHV